MKTFQQKANAAKKKVLKFSTDLDTMINKLDILQEDVEDDDFSDKVSEIMDVLYGVIDGENRANFPDLLEYLEELAERDEDE